MAQARLFGADDRARVRARRAGWWLAGTWSCRVQGFSVRRGGSLAGGQRGNPTDSVDDLRASWGQCCFGTHPWWARQVDSALDGEVSAKRSRGIVDATDIHGGVRA